MLGLFGLTLALGLTGGLALVLGYRRTAGLLWFALGSGALGVFFDRVTRGRLRFNAAHQPTDEELDFLISHTPFLILGTLLLLGVGEETEEATC